MTKDKHIECSNCKYVFSDLPNLDEITECPKCGSKDRHVIAVEPVKLREQTKLVGKDLKRPGKQKIRREVISGDDLHRKSGKWYDKDRVIDKDADEYMEKVTDPETGRVIHYSNEPLSQHKGHGSAKTSKRPKRSN